MADDLRAELVEARRLARMLRGRDRAEVALLAAESGSLGAADAVVGLLIDGVGDEAVLARAVVAMRAANARLRGMLDGG